MRYLENYNRFKVKEYQYQEVNEKWYHNILSGLMMLAPSIVGAQNLNAEKNINNIELSQEDSIEDIQSIINYVKSNPKEYKNGKQVVKQIENLIRKYEQGIIDLKSISIAAQKFAEQSKEMKNPRVGVKNVDANDKHTHTSSWTKLHEISNLDTVLIEGDMPREIILNIFEEGRFESGSYKVDSTLSTNINDTLIFFHSNGYKVEYVVIESSTDGQQLSDNLKQSLKSNGYKPNNEGLSEIRNDKLLEYVKSNTDISVNIGQDIHFHDDGEINDSLRYNKVIIKVTKTKESDTKMKVTEKTVEVYYKITDYDRQKVKNGNKKGKYNKTKGGGGIHKGGKSGECYIFGI